MSELTPDLLLQGYAVGIFPMSEHRDDPEIFWVDPRRRGILPLDGFHISRSLARALRRTPFQPRLNFDFAQVVAACADRADTWINAEITRLYQALHEQGRAHSYEIWESDTLVGGVYGVSLGTAFFGESMFSRRDNASKMALAGLVDVLKRSGFTLFDTQFLTSHLASLGAVEISRAAYHTRLDAALVGDAQIMPSAVVPLYEVTQRMTQTS
ncbi:leucyl/phenylalanyl-tRNA--protein transferase [Sulfitobacter brevis]|uniref:Leucyl/phenylalanyl-tRNA--protein transferase n=1 Tax=Sulfitobacter brevis TaxID=74348 RepID=A0A1I1ZGB9_9RHOB|nr:leucyl/phenylalanyl-tRNA--protein transferase [Sulfitobacter brevis]SFE30737.1 leucyl/phenylalanyl-tRNA--protein transferase [Sulfitobacter brevis]